MSRTWIITDTHFDHDLMMDVCGRPVSFSEMIYRGLSKLSQNDLLIVLGDIGLGRAEHIHAKYIIPLTCHKVLVRGNHDRETNSWYLRHGWDFVCDTFTDRYMGYSVLFSHLPYDLHFKDAAINIHGHFHNNDIKTIRKHDGDLLDTVTPAHIQLVLEDTDYRPLLVDNVLGMYSQGQTGRGMRMLARDRDRVEANG